MALPFEPELEEGLQARYKDAVAEVIDIREIKSGVRATPGKERRHVFDFYDGLRLIVSRETDGTHKTIHFSASMSPTNPFKDLREYVGFVVGHVCSLSGCSVNHDNVKAVMAGTILHLVYEDKEVKPRANPMWN